MRVLAVSSQVAFGPVGNSAAVPALQAAGHEVLAIPTITLSNHPGHGKPAGFRTSADDIGNILATLETLGVLDGVGAVMTGYFASPEQIAAMSKVLMRMKAANSQLYVLVDPVLGDEEGLYVHEAVAEAIASDLVPLATCITPNRFELAWLSGRAVDEADGAIAAARMLGTAEVLATSIPTKNMLSTMLVTADGQHAIAVPRLAGVPHGTGDLLSGLYLARRITGPARPAFASAMTVLGRAIALSAGTPVLDVAGALQNS
jgi:pyridoxine kinase